MIARAWGFIIIHPISRNDNDERKEEKKKKKKKKEKGLVVTSIPSWMPATVRSSTRHQPQYHQYIGTLEGVLALEWKRGEAISKAAHTQQTLDTHRWVFLFIFLPGCLRAYSRCCAVSCVCVCKGENVCLALTCAQAPEFGYIVRKCMRYADVLIISRMPSTLDRRLAGLPRFSSYGTDQEVYISIKADSRLISSLIRSHSALDSI